MTNGEKFKGVDERCAEFKRFCRGFKHCEGCPIESPKGFRVGYCILTWLELEAKEVEPLPCPYCGGYASVYLYGNGWSVKCNEGGYGCGYCSRGFADDEKTSEECRREAIAAHNRFAKLVLEQTIKAAKESEVAR